MKYLSLLIFCLVLVGCKSETESKNLSAESIINKSIEISGGEIFNNATLRFNFRDKYYLARRDKSYYSLIRISVVDNDSVFDLLSNEGFERLINNETLKLEDSIAAKYSASVNSVHYFSVLPHGLNDKSVNKKLLEDESIKGKDYHKIEVTFNQDGGGEDYEDVFIYWINKTSFKPDYFAYSYNEDDGVGMRFREAYNERYIEGLRFVDYNNYKPESKAERLTDLGKAYEKNMLKLLSKIELENVEVELIAK